MEVPWLEWIVELPPIADFLVRATALLAAGWLLGCALRRANPRWRVLLWRGVAAGLIAMPPAMLLLPAVPIPVVRSAAHAPTAAGPAAGQTAAVPLQQAAKRFPDRSSAPVDSAFPERGAKNGRTTPPPVATDRGTLKERLHNHGLPLPLWVVWMSGVALLAVRFWQGMRRIRKLIADSPAAPDSIAGQCRRIAAVLESRYRADVRVAPHLSTPFLTGIRRPVLLLPERMCASGYRTELPGILAHELSHLRTNDVLWSCILHWATILFWFHPLVWRLSAAHATACEQVSDAVSATYVGGAGAYSRTLARVASDLAARPPMVAGIPMARVSEIRRRLQTLQRGVFAVRLRRRSVMFAGFLGLTALVTLTALRFVAASPTAQELEDEEEVFVPPPLARTVHFPKGSSLGILLMRDWDRTDEKGWKSFAEARGDVSVPPGKHLKLWTATRNPKDLSPLARLGPDDVQVLAFDYVPPAERPLPLAHLKGLTDLRELHVSQIPIVEADLVHLGGLTRLQRLSLSNARVGDAGTTHIARLRSLRRLYLSGTQITDAGLADLGEMKSLRMLSLNCTKITDEGLRHLEGLKRLTWIDLQSTEITRDGLARLQEALPECQIVDSLPDPEPAPPDRAPQALVWGQPVNGLRAALEFVPERKSYMMGQVLDIRIHVQNVTTKTVEFICPGILEIAPHVVDSKGKEMPMSHSAFAWVVQRVTHRLAPGQTVALRAISIAFVDNRTPPGPLPSNKAVGSVVSCRPGQYSVWYELHLGDYDKKYEATGGPEAKRRTGVRALLLAGPSREAPVPARGERIRW